MSHESKDPRPPAGTTEEIREHVEATRDALGKTVEALAAKTDVKARAQHKAAEVGDLVAAKASETTAQVRETTAQVREKAAGVGEAVAAKAGETSAQVREKAAEAGQLVQDSVPAALRAKAGEFGRAGRDHRVLYLAAAGLVAVYVVARLRGRRR
ncbi:DUF3618 domain-containing protein [Streptomyces sp. NPDC101733]|uniref:DUF3618 domain-containing protein n=1 Tax=unclassified Streptomyces TaxID=2593676 RepID=UPI0038044119